MARQGRNFEKLIEKLEKSAGTNSLNISSPKYLIDKSTGGQREIDILVSVDHGTITNTVAFECRDRKSKQGVEWIEAIISKYNDLDVDKVIAVSTGGFTKGALAKAKRNHIETRTFGEIDLKTVEAWWHMPYITKFDADFKFISSGIKYFKKEDEQYPDKSIVELEWGKKIFYDKVQENKISPSNIFYTLRAQYVIQDHQKDLDLNGTSRIKLEWKSSNQEQNLFMEIENIELQLEHLWFDVDLSLETTIWPLTKAMQYVNEEKEISTIMEYGGIFPRYNIQFIRNPDGSISLSSSER
ncbi:MAG: restriction endonuclease [Bacteroidia bacterium]